MLLPLSLLSLMSTQALADEVRVLAIPPCLATFRASGRVNQLANDDAKRSGGDTSTRALGLAGLRAGNVLFLPDPDPRAVDAQAPTFVVGAAGPGAKAAGVDVKETVVAERLPALLSPEELTFAMPGAPAGYVERIFEASRPRGESPDIELVHVRVWRVQANSKSALRVQLLDGQPMIAHDPDVSSWERVFSGVVDVKTAADGHVQLVTAIFIVGGHAKLSRALDDARARASAAGAGVVPVMMGGIAGYPPRADLCADVAAGVAPDVVVPGRLDLAAGIAGMSLFAQRARATFVAANLEQGKLPGDLVEDVHLDVPLRKVVERDVDGLRVAVVGVVDPALEQQLPLAARGQWRITDPYDAVARLLEQLASGTRIPDVIVVATTSPELLPKLALLPHADVVVAGGVGTGNDGRTDALDVRTTIQLGERAREFTREPAALWSTIGSSVAIREIAARFAPVDAGARHRKLVEIVDEARPVTAWSDVDLERARPFRRAEEAELARDTVLLFPRLDELLAPSPPAVASLARGSGVAYRGQIISIDPDDPPMWTDALLHRLAAKALRDAFDADAAFTATTPRRSDLGNAAVSRRFVRDWLTGKGNVRLVDLRGDMLLKLADAVARQAATFPPIEHVYVSALDVKTGIIGGRKIDPAVTYRVVLDDKTALRADFAAILSGAPPAPPPPSARTFAKDPSAGADASASASARGAAGGARYRFAGVDEGGREVDAGDVVLEVISPGDDANAPMDEARLASLASLLADESSVVEPEWRLQVEALELRGTGGQSSSAALALQYAKAGEARVLQPGFVQIGARLGLAAVYDSAAFAWDTRFRLQYDQITLQLPPPPNGPGVQIQNTLDDVVLSTEARLNSISVHIGADDAGGFRLVPFARVAADSELTPSIDLTALPDIVFFPRQALLRESAGVAAMPGNVWREVRVGVIVQHDFSDFLADVDSVIRHDVGVGVESHAAIPLWRFILTSDIDVRGFIPDGDDDPARDLALRGQLVHRLALPVSASTSVFAFLDALVFVGKDSTALPPGWNAIAGAGVTFADLWRW